MLKEYISIWQEEGKLIWGKQDTGVENYLTYVICIMYLLENLISELLVIPLLISISWYNFHPLLTVTFEIKYPCPICKWDVFYSDFCLIRILAGHKTQLLILWYQPFITRVVHFFKWHILMSNFQNKSKRQRITFLYVTYAIKFYIKRYYP